MKPLKLIKPNEQLCLSCGRVYFIMPGQMPGMETTSICPQCKLPLFTSKDVERLSFLQYLVEKGRMSEVE